MTTSTSPKTTTAFYVQSIASFTIALVTVIVGILYLDIDPWVRAFLGLGTLYLITSAFTLAKCVRDQQDESALTPTPGPGPGGQASRRARPVPRTGLADTVARPRHAVSETDIVSLNPANTHVWLGQDHGSPSVGGFGAL